MAKNELYDSGVKVISSFSATGAFPVDGKYVVETIEQRDDHVTQGRAYEGMLVYVISDGVTYQYKPNSVTDKDWYEFGLSSDDKIYDGLDSDSGLISLSARQGAILKSFINNHENDTIVHITNEERERWNSIAKGHLDLATPYRDGLMSKEDKAKLDDLANASYIKELEDRVKLLEDQQKEILERLEYAIFYKEEELDPELLEFALFYTDKDGSLHEGILDKLGDAVFYKEEE